MKKENKNETLNEQTIPEEEKVEKEQAEVPQEETPQEETPVEQPVEDVKVEENNTESTQQEPVDPNAPIVIDNTVEAPTQPIQDVPRYAKIKEPMSKKKKITILVASIAAFIVVFSIVFFPLYFCYIQGRIHIYDASDFIAQEGKRFVLEKDIVVEGDLDLAASSCPIDLNGHNLTVEGTLTLGNSIEVGTLKKGEYTSKGLLIVDSLVVNGGNFNFASSVTAKTITLTAENVSFDSVSLVTEAAFTANSIEFKAPLTVSSEDTIIGFKNCSSVVFKAEVQASTVFFENSNVILNNTATANKFAFDSDLIDSTSTLQAYGKLQAVTGGKKVVMLKGHECNSYDGINILAIYDAFNDTYTATNCDTIVYLETLPAPVDFIVSEEGGSFRAVCAEVEPKGIVKYQFYFDDQKYEVSNDPSVDITDALKAAGAATHKLQVYTIGNYSFDGLDDMTLVNGKTLYLDSEVPATLEYAYTLKLTTPKAVSVTKDDKTISLSYTPVEFADYYVLTIDGTEKYILTSSSKETFESEHASIASEYGNKIIQYDIPSLVNIKAEITDQVSSLGYHSLRLVACSFSKEIETSKEAMTSYKTTKAITLNPADVVAQSKKNDDGTYTNTITINNCEEGKVFLLDIEGIGEVRLSNERTYTFVSTKSYVGRVVSITAEAYGFYEATTLPDPKTFEEA